MKYVKGNPPPAVLASTTLVINVAFIRLLEKHGVPLVTYLGESRTRAPVWAVELISQWPGGGWAEPANEQWADAFSDNVQESEAHVLLDRVVRYILTTGDTKMGLAACSVYRLSGFDAVQQMLEAFS